VLIDQTAQLPIETEVLVPDRVEKEVEGTPITIIPLTNEENIEI
jgi:hypothetical protein